MGKLHELARMTAGNVDESIGVGRSSSLGQPPAAYAVPPKHVGVTKSKVVSEIALDRIERDPSQPREEFDPEALDRLAASLKTRGQLQPIRVRWDEGRGVYVIVCGERRWRAAKAAGLATITSVVMEGKATPEQLLAIQVVENALREDLRPIEQARAYRSLMDANGWTMKQVAEEIGVSHSAVTRSMSLLSLPDSAQADVDAGELSPTAAYEITKIEDRGEREELAARAVKEKMTYGEVKAARENRDQSPKRRKVEHRDRNGCVVSITLPPELDEEDAVAAMQRAIKWMRSRPRTDAA